MNGGMKLIRLIITPGPLPHQRLNYQKTNQRKNHKINPQKNTPSFGLMPLIPR